jgi:type VI secretion system secreted protein Hcp
VNEKRRRNAMAFQAHISIKGKKQGQFKGEGIQDKRKDKWMPVLAFGYAVQSPRDAATGQARGKRQHKPIVITKEWGAATPQLFQALTTNETLDSVEIEFEKVNANGEEYVYHTIKLTNASIFEIRQYTREYQLQAGQTSKHPGGIDTGELEDVSFTFQKIEMENKDGKTTSADDWSQ